MNNPFAEITIPGLRLFKKGKVREVYDLEDHLLVVASDRISAFDYVLPSLIPDKGKVLTQISKFWFDFTSLICPNHFVTDQVDQFPPELHRHREILDKRAMYVKKTEVIPVECIVRGYISGSGWKDYRATGKICGIKLPSGLRESDQLEEVIFTPSTKADEGHDMNISFKEMQKTVGADLALKIKKVSVELYKKASLHALSKGIIIADTKFEWGWCEGRLILVDEVLTPDSSRFWPADQYAPGAAQRSFDKQFVREWLDATDWDKNSPPPSLPDDIVARTRDKYIEAYERLAGREFSWR